jgi:hypothetical protein
VLGFERANAPADAYTVKFRELYRTDPPNLFSRPTPIDAISLPSILGLAVVGRTAAPTVADRTPMITVEREPWKVRDGTTRRSMPSETAAHFHARPATTERDAAVAAPSSDLVTLGAI